MKIVGVLLVVWLIIGAFAGLQRHYYTGGEATCTRAGTVAATIAAGPLNYVGANPRVHCRIPQPSR